MPERLKGKIVKWLENKGFGFITPEEPQPNGKDIWVHSREIKVDAGKFVSIAVGSEVEFIIKPAQDPDTFMAAEVTGPGGAPLKNMAGDGPPPRHASRSRTPPRRGGGGGRRDDSRSRSAVRRTGGGRGPPGGDRGGGGGGRGAADPGKLFVGQLFFDATEDDLRDAFKKFGDLVQVQVIKDRETGKCKGYGFVKFAKPEDADDALKEMDGAELGGRALKIDRAAGGRSGGGASDVRHEPEKLFIGRLDREVTEEDVREHFKKVGELVSVQIIKDHDTGESKGFGFLKFGKAADAEEALKTLNESEIRGAPCRLERVDGPPKGKGKGKDKDGRGGGRSRSCRRPRGGPPRRGGGGGGSRSPSSRSQSHRDQRPLARRRQPMHDGGRRGDRERDYRDDDRIPRRGGGGGGGYRDEPPPRRRDDFRRGGDDFRGDRGAPLRRGGGGYRDDGMAPRRRRDRPYDDYEEDEYRRGGGGGRGGPPPPRRGDREPPGGDRGGPARGSRRGESRHRSRQPQQRSPSPEIPGVPKRSDAVRSARAEYEEALQASRRAQGKVNAAQARLRKVEKSARQDVARAVADADRIAKGKLADQIDRARKAAEHALEETLSEVRTNLESELKEKIVELKKSYEAKIEESQVEIRSEHKKRVEEDEEKLREQAEKKVEQARRKAEEESPLTEWQDEVDKATADLEKEEAKVQSAKKKLENLTGEPVRDPPPQRRAERDDEDEEDESESEEEEAPVERSRDRDRGRDRPERGDRGDPRLERRERSARGEPLDRGDRARGERAPAGGRGEDRRGDDRRGEDRREAPGAAGKREPRRDEAGDCDASCDDSYEEYSEGEPMLEDEDL